MTQKKPTLNYGLMLSGLLMVVLGYASANGIASKKEKLLMSKRGKLIVSEKISGPSSNIIEIDSNGTVRKLTQSPYWQDTEASMSILGDLVFSSNRKPEVKANIHKHRENFDIYIKMKHSDAPQVLANSEKHEVHPKFSPTGEYITYIELDASQQKLILIDKLGENKRILHRAANISDYTWSRDGKQITLSEENHQQYRLINIALNGGEQKILLDIHQESTSTLFSFESLIWSPDGKYLAYIRHPLKANTMRSLWLYNRDRHSHIQVSENEQQVQAGIDWSRDSHKLVYSALIDFSFKYNEEKRQKEYFGDMPIYVFDLFGGTDKISVQKGMHRYPNFSSNSKEVAFLYSEKLGGALHYDLKLVELSKLGVKNVHSPIARHSFLQWAP